MPRMRDVSGMADHSLTPTSSANRCQCRACGWTLPFRIESAYPSETCIADAIPDTVRPERRGSIRFTYVCSVQGREIATGQKVRFGDQNRHKPAGEFSCPNAPIPLVPGVPLVRIAIAAMPALLLPREVVGARRYLPVRRVGRVHLMS
jgi:hypothetical protein